ARLGITMARSLVSDRFRASMLVPSCCVIFDIKPLSLSFNFVFEFEIFKSFPGTSQIRQHDMSESDSYYPSD
ncbi:hypothetical protein Tco_0718835, partial [Tanacetum coccineum]